MTISKHVERKPEIKTFGGLSFDNHWLSEEITALSQSQNTWKL